TQRGGLPGESGGQVGEADDVVFGKDDGPRDGAPQLPHVAGPIVCEERAAGRGRHTPSPARTRGGDDDAARPAAAAPAASRRAGRDAPDARPLGLAPRVSRRPGGAPTGTSRRAGGVPGRHEAGRPAGQPDRAARAAEMTSPGNPGALPRPRPRRYSPVQIPEKSNREVVVS